MASPPRDASGAGRKLRRVSATAPAGAKTAPGVWPEGPAPVPDAGFGGPGAQAETEWLKVEEVAAILRLPLSTTYELVRTGQIPSVKLGKHRRIRREVLIRLGR